MRSSSGGNTTPRRTPLLTKTSSFSRSTPVLPNLKRSSPSTSFTRSDTYSAGASPLPLMPYERSLSNSVVSTVARDIIFSEGAKREASLREYISNQNERLERSASFEGDCGKLRGAMRELETELNMTHTKFTDAVNRNCSLEQAREAIESDRNELGKKAALLEYDLSEERRKREEAAAVTQSAVVRAASLDAQCSHQEVENTALAAQVTSLRAMLSETRTESDRRENELGWLQDHVPDLEERAERSDTLILQVEELTRTVSALRTTNEKYSGLQISERILSDALARAAILEPLALRVEGLEADNARWKICVTELEGSLVATHARLADLASTSSVTVANLEARLLRSEELGKRLAEEVAYDDGSRGVMRAAMSEITKLYQAASARATLAKGLEDKLTRNSSDLTDCFAVLEATTADIKIAELAKAEVMEKHEGIVRELVEERQRHAATSALLAAREKLLVEQEEEAVLLREGLHPKMVKITGLTQRLSAETSSHQQTQRVLQTKELEIFQNQKSLAEQESVVSQLRKDLIDRTTSLTHDLSAEAARHQNTIKEKEVIQAKLQKTLQEKEADASTFRQNFQAEMLKSSNLLKDRAAHEEAQKMMESREAKAIQLTKRAVAELDAENLKFRRELKAETEKTLAAARDFTLEVARHEQTRKSFEAKEAERAKLFGMSETETRKLLEAKIAEHDAATKMLAVEVMGHRKTKGLLRELDTELENSYASLNTLLAVSEQRCCELEQENEILKKGF